MLKIRCTENQVMNIVINGVLELNFHRIDDNNVSSYCFEIPEKTMYDILKNSHVSDDFIEDPELLEVGISDAFFANAYQKGLYGTSLLATRFLFLVKFYVIDSPQDIADNQQRKIPDPDPNQLLIF